MRPCPPDGLPYIGRVRGTSNAYMVECPPPTAMPCVPATSVSSHPVYGVSGGSAIVVATSDGCFRQASGHNCWGILWAPITGKAISQLILDGDASCADLTPFDPSRFSPREDDGDRVAGQRTGQGRGRRRGATPVGEQW